MLKTENRLLTTKTGLARAAIRNFLNDQVLDCYLQGNSKTFHLMPRVFFNIRLGTEPGQNFIFKNRKKSGVKL